MKQIKCCNCKKPLTSPYKSFESKTYYHCYHHEHIKRTYWCKECWDWHEKKNEDNHEKEMIKIKEQAKKLGIKLK